MKNIILMMSAFLFVGCFTNQNRKVDNIRKEAKLKANELEIFSEISFIGIELGKPFIQENQQKEKNYFGSLPKDEKTGLRKIELDSSEKSYGSIYCVLDENSKVIYIEARVAELSHKDIKDKMLKKYKTLEDNNSFGTGANKTILRTKYGYQIFEGGGGGTPSFTINFYKSKQDWVSNYIKQKLDNFDNKGNFGAVSPLLSKIEVYGYYAPTVKYITHDYEETVKAYKEKIKDDLQI